MTINSLKELESVLKLCRRQGVKHIKIDNIEMSIEDLPEPKTEPAQKDSNIPPGLSDEDLLLWSAGIEV